MINRSTMKPHKDKTSRLVFIRVNDPPHSRHTLTFLVAYNPHCLYILIHLTSLDCTILGHCLMWDQVACPEVLWIFVFEFSRRGFCTRQINIVYMNTLYRRISPGHIQLWVFIRQITFSGKISLKSYYSSDAMHYARGVHQSWCTGKS